MRGIVLGSAFFGILALLLLALIVFSIPFAKSYASCYEEGANRLNQQYIRAERASHSNERVCTERYEIINEIRLCFNVVEKSQSFPFNYIVNLVKIVSPRFEQLDRLITNHNISCELYSDLFIK